MSKRFHELFLIFDIKYNKKMNILNDITKIINAFIEMKKIKFIFFFDFQRFHLFYIFNLFYINYDFIRFLNFQRIIA